MTAVVFWQIQVDSALAERRYRFFAEVSMCLSIGLYCMQKIFRHTTNS